MRLSVLALLLFAVVTSQGHGSTEKSMLSVHPANEAQLAALKDLEGSNDFVEFLDKPTELKTINILVTPELKGQLVNVLQNAGMTVTDNTPQLLKHIRKERSVSSGTVLSKRGICERDEVFPTHERYYTLSEINAFMAKWAKCHPTFARVGKMENKTYENRDVYYIEIGPKSRFRSGFDKKVIMIESLTYPREWISSAATLYAIDTLLRLYSYPSTQLFKLLSNFNFVFIPVVNPDGYEYTWTKDRMWRNNRRVINATCTGVNLNRNYDVKFRTTGITKACGSPNYPGETAFSEAETQNVRNLYDRVHGRLLAFLSVHAYSKVLLYPWGYINNKYNRRVPSNVESLKTMGKEMVKEMKGYRLGTALELLKYGASGAAEDWALQEKPGIYAYYYGLRPELGSRYGFSLPPSEIRPTGQEFTRSLIKLVRKSAEFNPWIQNPLGL